MAALVDVGDRVGVLVPDGAGVDPAIDLIGEHPHAERRAHPRVRGPAHLAGRRRTRDGIAAHEAVAAAVVVGDAATAAEHVAGRLAAAAGGARTVGVVEALHAV